MPNVLLQSLNKSQDSTRPGEGFSNAEVMYIQYWPFVALMSPGCMWSELNLQNQLQGDGFVLDSGS